MAATPRPLTISGSVGRNGLNRRDDVLLVQQLINQKLPLPLRPLDVDGLCGHLTIGAIEEIQRRDLHMHLPDGRVDPTGATLRFLTGIAPAPPKPHTGPGHFPPDVIAAAQASQARWKIPAAVTLAQWAIESNFGRAMPSGRNNPFGIKAAAGQPYVEAHTQEVIHGKTITNVAKFRRFASIKDAFDEHGRLLGLENWVVEVSGSTSIGQLSGGLWTSVRALLHVAMLRFLFYHKDWGGSDSAPNYHPISPGIFHIHGPIHAYGTENPSGF